MKILNALRYERNLFFAALGTRRLNRILFCSFIFSAVWCLADFRSGNLNPKFTDDIICFAMGIVAERLIPWGKPPTIELVMPENGQ